MLNVEDRETFIKIVSEDISLWRKYVDKDGGIPQRIDKFLAACPDSPVCIRHRDHLINNPDH